ncbi:hypothetical protein HF295_06700 [Hujiaoplasma nucleasis]|uniref:Uncharacterized protein n=1 Tax=Hujiaoplasma nucleasis TaxID=2725268 RepID=A0A7L6N4Y6_9MOLU|nr:hypothetical protein [Hujiaoplasma nucleasis]QLY40552.1 hypothetical protein HF295_06700 [Hujiaoplasma nucleasis]
MIKTDKIRKIAMVLVLIALHFITLSILMISDINIGFNIINVIMNLFTYVIITKLIIDIAK